MPELAPVVIARLVARYTQDPPYQSGADHDVLNRLTPREREVFVLLARGRSNQEISAEPYLGETTVKTHVARVLTKLGLRDRIQAVVFGYEHGVVRPGS